MNHSLPAAEAATDDFPTTWEEISEMYFEEAPADAGRSIQEMERARARVGGNE